MRLAESAQASRDPWLLRANVNTWPSWLFSRIIGSQVAMSQTRTVVSQPAENRRLPLGCQARLGMRSVWPERVPDSLPVDSSHSRINLSSAAEARRVPSRLKARALTGRGCALISRINCLVLTSHKRTAPSSCPVATWEEEGEKPSAVTQQGCSHCALSVPLPTPQIVTPFLAPAIREPAQLNAQPPPNSFSTSPPSSLPPPLPTHPT